MRLLLCKASKEEECFKKSHWRWTDWTAKRSQIPSVFECKQETLRSKITTSYIHLNIWLSGYFKDPNKTTLKPTSAGKMHLHPHSPLLLTKPYQREKEQEAFMRVPTPWFLSRCFGYISYSSHGDSQWALLACPRGATRICKISSTKHSTKPATPATLSLQGYWKQTTATSTLTQSPPRLSITSWFCCVQGQTTAW